MLDLFSKPFANLDKSDIQSFLDGAPAEPLHWEAKGTRVSRNEVRRQVCGFANSHDGGFLIMGATAHGQNWSLDGVEVPGDDPPAWVTNVAQDVRPFPEGLDVRSIAVAAQKWLVVVWIPPMPTPPCNLSGAVYERVSGQTIPVAEPLRLAELFARGDSARNGAESRAESAARAALIDGRQHPRYQYANAQFGFALTATGYGEDVAKRIFDRRFEQAALSSIKTVLFHDGVAGRPLTTRTDMAQEAIEITTVSADDRMGFSWRLRAQLDGAISLYWTQGIAQVNVSSLVDAPMQQAWSCVGELMGLLSPRGPRYLTAAVAGAGFPHNAEIRAGLPLPPLIRRGPLDTSRVDTAVLATIERELRRARGETVYEP